MGFLHKILNFLRMKRADRAPAFSKSTDARTTHALPQSATHTRFPATLLESKTPVNVSESSKSFAWHVGEVIENLYEVTEDLGYGKGGMGNIYKVYHKTWNVSLAVKSPKPEILEQQGGQENFVREAESWVNLGMHPNIVNCFYVRIINGIPRIFTEYISGSNLAEFIYSRKLYEGDYKTSLARLLDIAIQFARGLAFAHEPNPNSPGIIHQDVKPANVMIDEHGIAKLTDFGLARSKATQNVNSREYTKDTVFVSSGGMTLAYCSPEQAKGQPLSRKTDIWSWAVAILEMFVGEVTWYTGQIAHLALEDLLEQVTVDPTIPHIPHGLEVLLRHCFQLDPTDRPESMTVILEELYRIYEDEIGERYFRFGPSATAGLDSTYNNWALSMLDLGRTEEAIRYWENALETDPQSVAAAYNSGLVQWRLGHITDDQLLNTLIYISELKADPSLMSFLIGQIHLERGDFEQAASALTSSLQIGAERPEIMRLATSLLQKIPATQSSVRYRRVVKWTALLTQDGQYVYCGQDFGEICLCRVDTFQPIRMYRGHRLPVTSLALDSNEHFLASGSDDCTIQIWEIATGKNMRTLIGHNGGVTSVCFSGDGSLLLSGGKDSTLRLWNVASSASTLILRHPGHVNAVWLSKDGRYAISGSADMVAYYWDMQLKKLIHTFSGHTGLISAISVTSDERFVVTASWDHTIRLWEVTSGSCIRIFRGGSEPIGAVKISADGQYVFSGDLHGYLRFWEVDTGRCIRTILAHYPSNITCLDCNSTAQLAISTCIGMDPLLKIWDFSAAIARTESTMYLAPLVEPEQIRERRHKVASLLEQVTEAIGKNQFATAVALARQARAIEGFDRNDDVLNSWAGLYPYTRRLGLQAAWTRRILKGHAAGVTSVAIAQNAKYALSGSNDNTIRYWDLKTGRTVGILQGHTNSINSVSFCKGDTFAVSTSRDGTLKLWDLEQLRIVRTIPINGSRTVSVDPDTQFAFLENQIVDMESEHSIHAFSAQTGWAVAATPNGQYVLQVGTNVMLWDVAKDKCIWVIGGSEYLSVSLSGDGRRAVTSSYKQPGIQTWDIEKGTRLFVERPMSDWPEYRGHLDWEEDVCISNDGNYILSGARDRTMRLWDTRNGKKLFTFNGHTNIVNAVALSKDSRYALSASEDATLRLWELSWDVEAYEPVDWDDQALPYIHAFVRLHTPYATKLDANNEPTRDEFLQALTKRGKAVWNETKFENLLTTLRLAGLGWILPDGIRHKLIELTISDSEKP